MIKILIADDHQMFRAGMRSLINSIDQMEVVGEAASGFETIDFLKENQADIVLLDYNMPDLTGLESIIEIRKQKIDVKIIMLTMHNKREIIRDVLTAGADGYLLKDSSRQELIDAITEVQAGESYFVNDVKDSLKDSYRIPFEKKVIRLTPREKDVLKLICEELTTQEIADKLFISVNTVETHRKNLISKTGVKNGIGLVKFALTNGL
ncbi:response regulator transcription factor [bacterium SCSIO 12643]|nr:response regulator transcription factor [bacterium SCSIO 12643]